MSIENLEKADNILIIAIDNPHLCLARRLEQMIYHLIDIRGRKPVTVCGNYPLSVTCDRENVTMIPIHRKPAVDDETELYNSFKEFENVPLLQDITMPVSKLDLFEVAGFDGLIYPYRLACRLDWSGLEDLQPHYDMILIIGGSHFNYPLPEKILANVDYDENTPVTGIPIGPVTGPLSPHWPSACSRVLLSNHRKLNEIRKINEDIHGTIEPDFFDKVIKPPEKNSSDRQTDKTTVLLDWTFLHNWQLKAVLRELAADELRFHIKPVITTVTDETREMLWTKWKAILEEIEPSWVMIDTDEYYQTVQSVDAAVTFVGGRDIWEKRGDKGNVIVCDMVGWWRAFGFEGPDPLASPRLVLSKLRELAASIDRNAQ